MAFSNGLVSRRTVLRGLGTAVALPFLESLLPRSLARAATQVAPPRRLAFMYIPNGAHMANWLPKTEGADFQMTPILSPMAPYRDDMLVLGNLASRQGGGHAPTAAAYLTGTACVKTHGPNLRAGISADQIAAAGITGQTRLPSLELSIERFRGFGNCDVGYACVYEHTLAWSTPTTPLATESDPRLVFNRMFSSRPNDPSAALRQRERGSVLDAVLGQANSLNNRLSGTDKQKLDQYLTTVRGLEQRIATADSLPPVQLPEDVSPPRSIPADLTEHIRIVLDMMVLAFQTDSTRIITFMYGREASEQQYRMLGISGSHHLISHHRNQQENFDKLTKINTYHMEQLAYLTGRLKAIPEGAGTLLDHCMIAYGSGLSDGNAHSLVNLPMLVVGKGGGTLKTGRFINYPRGTPVTNLWLSLLEKFGTPCRSLGDSTGTLVNLV